MRMFSIAAVAASVTLGCSSPPPLEPALAERAKAAIAAEEPVPGTVSFRTLWLAELGEANGLVCGRIDAPAVLEKPELRVIYEDKGAYAVVEKHELWVGGGAMGPALLEQNRQAFNRLWETACKPTDPARWALFG
jgi:hypothetical protein